MGKRIVIYLVGLVVTSLGVALIIRSAVGAGPLDTVAVGFKQYFGLTIGIWSIVTQGLLVIITAIVEKAKPRLESIVAVVIRSWFLDIWFYIILADIEFSNAIAIQWLTYTVGLIAVGLGIGIYIEARFPKTPVDGLMIALSERFNWSMSVSRLVIESSAVTFGFLLGGPVGLGTVIMAITLGRIIQISNSIIRKLLTNTQKKSFSSNI